MSFHFQKIHLKDWLVYNGTVVLEFPNFDTGRNLIAIHGQNGFGKTSLLKALQFVFDEKFIRDEWLDYWNTQAQAGNEGQMEVCLEFTFRDSLFVLLRGAHFKRVGRTFSIKPYVQLWQDGEEVLDAIPDKIMQIIPRGCLQFVFFDGAEITRYARKQYDEGVRDAIELVLGIPAVRNLRDDLLKLIHDIEDEQQEVLLAEQKNVEFVREVGELEDEVSGYNQRKVELNDKLRAIQTALDTLDKEAAQIQAIEAEHAQLSDKHKRRADLKERYEQAEKEIEGTLEKAPLFLLLRPMSQVIEEHKARQGGSDRRANTGSRRQLLREILQSDVCVCGRPLDEHSEQQIAAEIERMEALSTPGNALSGQAETIGELSALCRQLSTNVPNGIDLIDRRAKYISQLEEIETDIARLKQKLEGHTVTEVQEVYQQKKRLEQQYLDQKATLQNIENNLQRCQDKLQERRRQLDQIASATSKGMGLTKTLAATRRMYAVVSEYVDQMVLDKRQKIEDLASEIFKSITNKPVEYAGVRVKDDYTLEVYRHDGSVVDNTQLSAGEKEVLSYSFITALNLSSPYPAPFVMDTPFGHLDSGHRDGLLKSLPRLSVQVFLLATDRDLPPEERDRIHSAIADEFVIRRDQTRAVSYIEKGD